MQFLLKKKVFFYLATNLTLLKEEYLIFNSNK